MIKPPIKRHGGKHYLAKKIIELFPDHTHYVEPYFGGGSVLLQKPDKWVEGHSEVINDLDGDLTTFWRVLQDERLFAEFKRSVEATPMSEVEFNSAYWVGGETDVERAVAFFILARQSRQGLCKDFATMSRTRTRRAMNEQASAWLTAIEGLDAVHARLKRVVIFNTDATKLIRQQDGEKSFFYLDPPYVHSSRTATNAYACEMSDAQHHELLDTLAELKGKFLLSGYPSPMYDAFAFDRDWNHVDIQIDNKASSAKVKEKKTERLWFNY